MQLHYDPGCDHRQLRALVITLLKAEKGSVVSGFSFRLHVNRKYGIDIDHHEYAYALDEMSRRGEAKYHDYHGGDTQYEIL